MPPLVTQNTKFFHIDRNFSFDVHFSIYCLKINNQKKKINKLTMVLIKIHSFIDSFYGTVQHNKMVLPVRNCHAYSANKWQLQQKLSVMSIALSN